MSYGNFAKLVAKFVFIFAIIAVVMGGLLYFSLNLLRGEYGIMDKIGKYTGMSFKKKEIVNGLILGTDESGLRTDVIIFASYNPTTKKISMISIPRDTRVSDSADKKINSLYFKGKEQAVIKDVESILGVKIKYYALVNFKGFRKLVDDIGGIPIDVPINMNYHDPYQNLNITINKGFQVLDGVKAEGFVRFRSGYPDADLGRIKAQHEFIKAAINQMLKPQNITKLPSMVKTISSNLKTNMTVKEMLEYVGEVTSINRDSILMETLPGEAKYINGGSYFVYDKDKTTQLIDSIYYYQEEIDDKAVLERNKNIKVEIYNGTDIPGIGTKYADQLKEKGFNVIRIGNYVHSNVKKTSIVEKNRKYEGSYIKNVLKFGDVKAEYEEMSSADIVVILGMDAQDN